MNGKLVERRSPYPTEERSLKRRLGAEQKATLNVLEQVGWLIRFVRHTAPGKVIAGLMDPNEHTMAILNPEGRLVEDCTKDVRH